MTEFKISVSSLTQRPPGSGSLKKPLSLLCQVKQSFLALPIWKLRTQHIRRIMAVSNSKRGARTKPEMQSKLIFSRTKGYTGHSGYDRFLLLLKSTITVTPGPFLYPIHSLRVREFQNAMERGLIKVFKHGFSKYWGFHRRSSVGGQRDMLPSAGTLSLFSVFSS